MPKRIVAQTVIIQREGVSVTPAIGSQYEFTAKEIEQIDRLNPEALEKVIAKDGATAGDETLSLTQAQLDAQVNAGVEKQRAQLEKDIRAQLEQEAKDKETSAKTANKKAGSKDEEI